MHVEERLKRELTIGDVLEQYPDAAPLLTEKGIHCVGCHVSPYETLEDGFRSHGMNEEQIDATLAEINEKLDTVMNTPRETHAVSSSSATLDVTDLAVSKVLELLEKEGKDPKDTVLRVAVLPGGCAGFRYDFSFAANEKKQGDIAIEKNRLTVLVDEKSLQFMNGSTIDYTESLHGAGFTVTNPTASKGCGCGKSFG